MKRWPGGLPARSAPRPVPDRRRRPGGRPRAHHPVAVPARARPAGRGGAAPVPRRVDAAHGVRRPVPRAGRAGGGHGQGRRRGARLAGVRVRLRGGRHGDLAPAAGQPEAAAVPAAGERGRDQPDGVQQPRRRRAGRAAAAAGAGAGSGGDQRREVQVGDRCRGRLRRVGRGAVALRRLLRGQRQLTQHARAAGPAGPGRAGRAARRRRAGGPGAAGAGEDRPGPDRSRPSRTCWRCATRVASPA